MHISRPRSVFKWELQPPQLYQHSCKFSLSLFFRVNGLMLHPVWTTTYTQSSLWLCPLSALTAGIRINCTFSELVAVNSTVLVNTSLTTGARPIVNQAHWFWPFILCSCVDRRPSAYMQNCPNYLCAWYIRKGLGAAIRQNSWSIRPPCCWTGIGQLILFRILYLT